MIPRILVIAGSDSGGGAGIQADIKTITMLGGHAMTAVTAITAQNTIGVQAAMPVPTDMVMAQIRSVASDMGIDAVKIGMLGSAETARAVADWLAGTDVPVVFDPVMIATSGATLADADAVAAFDGLIARATLVTPNLPELAALGGETAMRSRGRALLVKGGHGDGETVVDRLIDADGTETCWTAARIDTRQTHGTGCTLASAVATGLATRMTLIEAIARARTFVRIALLDAPGLGAGHGPVGQGRVRLDVALGAPMFNQITLPAIDHAESVAFYAALGLRQIVAAAPRYARFENAGGVTLSIETAEAIDDRPLVYFECADLDAVVTRLTATGIAITGVRDESWGWREARLRDPAGNALCLYQAGEMRRFPPWRVSCPA